MATTKVKRSVHKKQSARSTYLRKLLRLPDAKGKTVEAVELSIATDYHAISINFQDKTCLHFSLDTGLAIRTDYSSWKTGNQRMICPMAAHSLPTITAADATLVNGTPSSAALRVLRG